MSGRENIIDTLRNMGVNVPNGYILNNFNAFQKVNNEIYVYVTPELAKRWKVQAYLRKDTSICSLEARIHYTSNPTEENELSNFELSKRYINNISRLFELAEIWLERYGNNAKAMRNDPYAPGYNWIGKDITTQILYSSANNESKS